MMVIVFEIKIWILGFVFDVVIGYWYFLGDLGVFLVYIVLIF